MAFFLLFLFLSTPLGSIAPVLGSCAHGTSLAPRDEPHGSNATAEINTFGYSGLSGPLNWVALDPATNIACGKGKRQSPIDIKAGVFTAIPGRSIALNLPPIAERAVFANLGTTVEVSPQKGGTMLVGGVTYALQQFHFHLPSEHLDDGCSTAMEMHMVWEGPQQEVAVIGIFIDIVSPAGDVLAVAQGQESKRRLKREAIRPGSQPVVVSRTLRGGNPDAEAHPATSALLESVFSSVEAIKTPGSAAELGPLAMSELAAFLSAGDFRSYTGSLTTPPCSEGVQWLVSTRKLRVRASTHERVRNVIGFNSRYLQNELGESNLLEIASQSLLRG